MTLVWIQALKMHYRDEPGQVQLGWLKGNFVFLRYLPEGIARLVGFVLAAAGHKPDRAGSDFEGSAISSVPPLESAWPTGSRIAVQPALNQDSTAFSQILVADFSGLSPGRDAEPRAGRCPEPVGLPALG